MKIAAVEAIAELARVEASEVVAAAYGGAAPVFGPDYIIPKPFDPRLILEIAPAVARAAMDNRRGAPADRAISRPTSATWSVSCSAPASSCGRCSRPPSTTPQRIVYAEGEDERVLRAAQTLVDDDIARPILLGRRDGDRAQGPRDGAAPGPRPTASRCSIRRRTTTCSTR